jgi:hypothetical protein
VDRFALWMLMSSNDGGRTTPFLSRGRRFVSRNSTKLIRFGVFLAFLFVLGLAEEYLWECLVWHDFTDQLWGFDLMDPRDTPPIVYSAVTAVLILPQAVHYWLDAFLWKHSDDENPGLALNLCLTTRPVPGEWLQSADDAK